MVQVEKIALGTAQFGFDYGIANPKGRLSQEEVFSVLKTALANNINTLDTAYSYGASENVIGEYIAENHCDFRIISKLPDMSGKNTRSINDLFTETLKRLGKKDIYACLVHSFKNSGSDKEIWEKLGSFKREGLVKKIGVSLYNPEELEYLLDSGIEFDLVQLPYNIFDQRFVEYLPVLAGRKISVYARSVFLQGLFFLPLSRIEKDFNTATGFIKKLNGISQKYQIPVPALCLCFVILDPFVTNVVIGIDSSDQLRSNISFLLHADSVNKIYDELKDLKMEDEKILLPYNWL
jgi:Predicted oxidoreductases (related to aryl-alcohol dehydrogenases)